jgi:hypothetical protein
MKVEKSLKSLMAIVCMMVMALSFNSCSNDDDDNENFICYIAEGQITGSDLGATFSISDYTTAIKSVFGGTTNGSYTAKDTEVIAACDAVYQKHKTDHPTWKGQIKIKKAYADKMGEIISSSYIKTYDY